MAFREFRSVGEVYDRLRYRQRTRATFVRLATHLRYLRKKKKHSQTTMQHITKYDFIFISVYA